MRKYDLVCALTLVAGAALSGCVAHAQATGYAEAEAPVVFVEPPTLVEVDADVWVVRDYDYAVYYVDGFYWVYRNDVWWRSRAYDKGWARAEVSVVPVAITKRDHHAYVRFHGAPGAKTRPGPREQLASESDSHRGPPDHAAEQHGGPPGHDDVPGLGNQRKAEDGNPGLGKGEEKKDEKREEKIEKKEEKKEEKVEKKDDKKDHGKDDKKGGPKKK
jgi:hypothetical protein